MNELPSSTQSVLGHPPHDGEERADSVPGQAFREAPGDRLESPEDRVARRLVLAFSSGR